jgi:hypothetical protein
MHYKLLSVIRLGIPTLFSFLVEGDSTIKRTESFLIFLVGRITT